MKIRMKYPSKCTWIFTEFAGQARPCQPNTQRNALWLFYGNRTQYKPRKHFKNCSKAYLAACHIEDPEWETAVCYRNKLRRTIYCMFLENINFLITMSWANVKREAQSISWHAMNVAEYFIPLQISLATRSIIGRHFANYDQYYAANNTELP